MSCRSWCRPSCYAASGAVGVAVVERLFTKDPSPRCLDPCGVWGIADDCGQQQDARQAAVVTTPPASGDTTVRASLPAPLGRPRPPGSVRCRSTAEPPCN